MNRADDMAERRPADELVIDLGASGLIRARREVDNSGAAWAEIRVRIPLADNETAARRQVLGLLIEIRELALALAARRRPAPRRDQRNSRTRKD